MLARGQGSKVPGIGHARVGQAFPAKPRKALLKDGPCLARPVSFSDRSGLSRQVCRMRPLLPGLLLIGCIVASSSHSADEKPHRVDCLSSGDALEAVSTRKVIAPDRAIVLAKDAAPGGEIVRAALCHDGDGLIYLVL